MTTRPFPARLSRALRARLDSLVDTGRPEGLAFLAAAGGAEIANATGSGPLEKACKPLIVPSALAIALRDGGLGPVDTALLSMTAAAYTTGDVILMLGDGHADESMRRVVSGAVAFGVGHVALGSVMIRAGLRPTPLQMALHGAAAGTVGALLLREDARGNAPLAAYGALLAALSALATSVGPRAGRDASVLAVAGPVFLLSDALILARRKSADGTARARLLDVGILDTYATAALLLLTGTSAAARTRRNS